MTRQNLRRLFAGLPALALTLMVLFLSSCGDGQPGVASTSENQVIQSTSSTAVPSTVVPARDESWDLQLT
jgi:hypothetical protein